MKIAVIIVFLSFSCSNKSKDKAFCSCLEAGNDLNKKTASILTEEVTQNDKVEIMRLKGTKERACENYKAMSGPEMRKKMRECFEN